MERTRIMPASSPQDVDHVRALCRDFVTWLLLEFPDERARVMTYFEPVAWARTLAALPEIHARPKGAMLLARIGDRPVGCVSYHEMEPGIALLKRLFVRREARGSGIGGALVDVVLDSVHRDGYRLARLDTAGMLTGAIALYERKGFTRVAPFIDYPLEIRSEAIFMERPV